jgi:mono/diheme cytochrome c family protein
MTPREEANMRQFTVGVALVAAMVSVSSHGGGAPLASAPSGPPAAADAKIVKSQMPETPVRYAAEQRAGRKSQAPAGQPPAPEPPEYGEYLARPKELASVATNDIVKSIRLNAAAMTLGKQVYDSNCAVCHGADLKGNRDLHAPDLTDAAWLFSGDDLPSGGVNKFPSDIEWTVRYGVRSGNPYARGVEADMLAYDPQYRSKEDIKDFGTRRFLTPEEIADAAEYVLQISGQEHDATKAARGDKLFHDNSKGNCADCHLDDGTGNDAIGSANLTQKNLFLYGSDRKSILETITRGRRGVMPAFERKLSPIEIKAVSVYVFARGKN